MPQVIAEVWIPVDPLLAFAVSQTTGEARLRWIRSSDGNWVDADRPGKGVRRVTRARIGPSMVSEYVWSPAPDVGGDDDGHRTVVLRLLRWWLEVLVAG